MAFHVWARRFTLQKIPPPMAEKWRVSMFAAICFLIAGSVQNSTAAPDLMAPSEMEEQQRAFFEKDTYCHHVLAVDADGNALLPRVTKTIASDGTPRYRAKIEMLAGEDTRGAKLDADELQALLNRKSSHPDKEQAVRNIIRGRKNLYLYLDAMFRNIEREKPDEVVIHIHGGLNKITGAIEKTALLADQLREASSLDHKIYYIGICWNSDLYPTYKDHLLSIREGLHQPGKAIITAPAMLLSDIGGAVSRLPLNLINFLYQDAYTVNPGLFKRTQLAQNRYDQIFAREQETGAQNTLRVSSAMNQRAALARRSDFAQWLLTQPAKVSTTLLLDWLGSEPWKNMLRRTRTMFERESEFIPSVDYKDMPKIAQTLSGAGGKAASADALLDQMNATGRQGAVYFFCNQAQARLMGAASRPKITLIGHSMGAIACCEILQRFHQLSFDNVVFMGAACSIRDFKTKVIPYLQEQNLREAMAGELTASLVASLEKQGGISAEALAEVRRQGGAMAVRAQGMKTQFYNLCLHDTAENGEKNPLESDLVQRGSLLTWIDVLYQHPESENDRTFGRWINALLCTDNLPGDVVGRITIKEFGVDRPWQNTVLKDYAYQPVPTRYVQEPKHHGDFGRFNPGKGKEAKNIAFWREIYRTSEFPPPEKPAPQRSKAGRRKAVASRKAALKTPRPPAGADILKPPTAPARDARTGF
jgi:hypothetical protein